MLIWCVYLSVKKYVLYRKPTSQCQTVVRQWLVHINICYFTTRDNSLSYLLEFVIRLSMVLIACEFMCVKYNVLSNTTSNSIHMYTQLCSMSLHMLWLCQSRRA